MYKHELINFGSSEGNIACYDWYILSMRAHFVCKDLGYVSCDGNLNAQELALVGVEKDIETL